MLIDKSHAVGFLFFLFYDLVNVHCSRFDTDGKYKFCIDNLIYRGTTGRGNLGFGVTPGVADGWRSTGVV